MAIQIDKDTENVLRLLCYVILADGHIFEEEIEALTKCAAEIGLKDKTGIALSDETVSNWFHTNKVELMHKNARADRDISMTHLILDLDKWPGKEKIVEALHHISAADGLVPREERLFTRLVSAYWQHSEMKTATG